MLQGCKPQYGNARTALERDVFKICEVAVRRGVLDRDGNLDDECKRWWLEWRGGSGLGGKKRSEDN